MAAHWNALFLISALAVAQVHAYDSCYESFADDKLACLNATADCQWHEHEDGTAGKCVMRQHSKGREHGDNVKDCNRTKEDGCYKSYGEDKAKCLEAKDHCQWLEKNGTSGKCASVERSVDGKHDKDGKGRKHGKHGKGGNGGNGRQMLVRGAVTVSLGLKTNGSASLDVLSSARKHAHLLSKAIHDVYGFEAVSILHINVARRLRAANATQLRIQFEAIDEAKPRIDVDAGGSAMQKTLQSYYDLEGIGLQVESASVELEISSGAPGARDQHIRNRVARFSKFLVASLVLCLAVVLVAVVVHRCRAKGDTKGKGAHIAEATLEQKVEDKTDICSDSASTGTPGSEVGVEFELERSCGEV